jgi:serine/threonine-protein kinase
MTDRAARHRDEEPPPLVVAGEAQPLAELCRQMLAKEPPARPSMAEVARRLRPRPPPPQLREGDRIGNYRLTRKLGDGGFGAVFAAAHEHIPDQQAAIKVLDPALSAQPRFLERFFNEARAASVLRRDGIQGIVEILDCGRRDDGVAYLIMELVPDGSLRHLLNWTRPPLPLYQQIAQAMAAAHARGVIHRDLKPENIMLRRDPAAPGGYQVRVVDFGIAKLAEARFGTLARRVRTIGCLGSPAYMAPEQWQDAGRVDAQADVYSLGVMLYEALSGALPFSAGDLAELEAQHRRRIPPPLDGVAPQAPRSLCTLVHAMLAKKPGDRPRMADVAEALAAELATLREPRPPRPRRLGPWLGGTAGAALLGLGILWGATRKPDPGPGPPPAPALVRVTVRCNKPEAVVLRKDDPRKPLGKVGEAIVLPRSPQPIEAVVHYESYRDQPIRLDLTRDNEQTVSLVPEY